MTKYFYIKYAGSRGILITADKLKRAMFQVEKLYNVKNKKLVKSVEISKEKFDRLNLWQTLKENQQRRQSKESSVEYLKRMGILIPVEKGDKYEFESTKNN